MESKKQFKEESNNLIKINNEDRSSISNFEDQFDFNTQTENLLKENVGNKAFENIKNIFEKTQTIKKVADIKHQEIQTQFKELRERLSQSSECLQRMKNGIENIKFSYQSKIYDMQQSLTPGDFFDPEKNPLQTKEDMARHMEEIKDKIEKIQKQISAHKEKQEKVTKSYVEAFENVSQTLNCIDNGTYSSCNVENVNKE
ncbi:uncharacterized protein LOC115879442 [Sitophilus oryzae]|uniref:Uncharacterized protein LOC115879442 n=1 Tax=Sitophilus oryzae TaxID=7048 RepID=A0A6J2XNA4_SITOR|nr:uncharacterized protein LOC115879442 [Sitophilus oryzae]